MVYDRSEEIDPSSNGVTLFASSYRIRTHTSDIEMYKRKNIKEKHPSLASLQSESFYIVKIDAPPGVEVPGGCYVTVQSGPHVGLKAAFERLRDPKPRAHTLPDIVFLPSNSSVLVLDENVPMKPHLLVKCGDLDKARLQQSPSSANIRTRYISTRGHVSSEVPANLTTPPGKIYRTSRILYTDEKEKDDAQETAKRQKVGKLSPKALFEGSDAEKKQDTLPDGATTMDNVSALRAACTAKLMWMLSNPQNQPIAPTSQLATNITEMKTSGVNNQKETDFNEILEVTKDGHS